MQQFNSLIVSTVRVLQDEYTTKCRRRKTSSDSRPVTTGSAFSFFSSTFAWAVSPFVCCTLFSQWHSRCSITWRCSVSRLYRTKADRFTTSLTSSAKKRTSVNSSYARELAAVALISYSNSVCLSACHNSVGTVSSLCETETSGFYQMIT